jgi:hypothetical protein
LPLFQSTITLVLLSTYTFTSESILNGQTIGKKALKIMVIKRNGAAPQIQDYFLRWSMRIIDYIVSVFSIGWAFMLYSPLNQRLGDLYADTIVIELQKSDKNRLNQLHDLNKKSSEIELTIPNIEKLNYRDVLLAKQLLNHQTIYQNKTQDDLITQVSQKFAQILSIDINTDSRDFLSDIINQYIFKTRN